MCRILVLLAIAWFGLSHLGEPRRVEDPEVARYLDLLDAEDGKGIAYPRPVHNTMPDLIEACRGTAGCNVG